MADYTAIKNLITDVVKTNGEQEITGANLQNVLVSMINAVASSNNEDFGRINSSILNLLNYVDTENEDIRNEMQELANRLDTNRYGYNVTVFGLVAGVHTLATAVKNVPPAERFGGQKITFKTDAGWVTYQNTSLSIDNYEDVNNWVLDSGVNVEGDVTITNNPDYEDLTQNNQNELKFADKEYNAATFSGLGRVYLRKNIVSNKNVLTQAMLADENTIYIIQYDYDLDGGEIEIPNGCLLDFAGGSLSNGTIKAFEINFKNKPILHNVGIVGKPFIDGEEVTIKLDKINRGIQLVAPLSFTDSEQSVLGCLEPAREYGINDFCYHFKSDSLAAASQHISIIDKYKINVVSLKIHVSLPSVSGGWSNYLNTLIIPLITNYPTIKVVYISNENSTDVSTNAATLISVADVLHNYGVKVGVSTNYNESVINSNLYSKLDVIGINYYPSLYYEGINTSFSSLQKAYSHDSSILKRVRNNLSNNKKTYFSEAGIICYLEAALYPSNWTIAQQIPVTYDKDLVTTSTFYKVVFETAKYCGIESVCIWYIETLKTFSEHISELGKKTLYNLFLNID